MGQEEVIIVLERERKPLTIDELQDLIKLSRTAIYHSLGVLLKYSEIKKTRSKPAKYSIKK